MTAPAPVLGAHVDQTDPVAEAVARGAGLAQFFLGDPQGYRGPEVRYAGGPAALREAADDPATGFDNWRKAVQATDLGAGRVAPGLLTAVVTAAAAPVVIETPGGVAEHSADLDLLRGRG